MQRDRTSGIEAEQNVDVGFPSFNLTYEAIITLTSSDG
jgi:hypothetical protein